jgi:hypothetical protein
MAELAINKLIVARQHVASLVASLNDVSHDLQSLTNAAELLQLINSEFSCCASLDSMLSEQVVLLRGSAGRSGIRQLVCQEYVCSLRFVMNTREVDVHPSSSLQGLHADLGRVRSEQAKFLQPVLLPLLTLDRFRCFVEDDRIDDQVPMGLSTAVLLCFASALLRNLDRNATKKAVIVTTETRAALLRKAGSIVMTSRIHLIDLCNEPDPTQDARPRLIICSPEHISRLDVNNVSFLAWDHPAAVGNPCNWTNLEGIIVRGHSRDASRGYPFVKEAPDFRLSSKRRRVELVEAADLAAVNEHASTRLFGVQPETVTVMAPSPTYLYGGQITSVGFHDPIPPQVSHVLVLEPDEACARLLFLSCVVEKITFITSQEGVARALKELSRVPERSMAQRSTLGTACNAASSRALI